MQNQTLPEFTDEEFSTVDLKRLNECVPLFIQACCLKWLHPITSILIHLILCFSYITGLADKKLLPFPFKRFSVPISSIFKTSSTRFLQF